MKSWYLILAGCILSLSVSAQNNLWTEVGGATKEAFRNTGKAGFPQELRLIRLNRSLAASAQAMAPAEANDKSKLAGVSFDIPLPDGTFLNAAIIETQVLSVQLSLQYSQIKTYQLVQPGTTRMLGKITITPEGVNGIIFTESGTMYLSPVGASYPDVHMVYAVKDVKGTNQLSCYQEGDPKSTNVPDQMNVPLGDCQLRTYRIAISTTGEYTFWAGGQGGAIAAATVTVNNVSAIFERDAAIRLTIVTNNALIYTDSTLDPFTEPPSLGPTTLNQNHAAQVSVLGSGSFDLGMVLHRGWNGGIAALSSVCNAANKGRAASGLNFGTGSNPIAGPQGPLFDGVVAHEIAHQFSAQHTFAAVNGGCVGNNNIATAWEPGGGSTLMGYAGVCAGNSYQNNTDLYFHGGSISQIISYATSGSGSCAVTTSLSNNAPTITVPANAYTIPRSTPFTLTATASDAEQSSLQFNWEQLDGGLATSTPPNATDVTGPNFRSFPYNSSSSRTFPRIQDIIAGTTSAYEVLPSVTRTLNFRVTVRDEAAGGGCAAMENIAVTTSAAAGPFIVTSQSSPTSWVANGSNTATITWNVAGTNAAPVNTANVAILFSTDGGLTYPYTILSGTPNDGSQVITIPNLVTNTGRIRVQAVNNVYFNINTAAITISSACAAEGTTFAPANNVTAPRGDASLDLALTPQYGSVVTISGTLAATDPASTLAVNNVTFGSCINFSNQYRYDTYRFTVNVTGVYTFTKSGPTTPLAIFNLYTDVFTPGNPCTGFLGSIGTYPNPPGPITIAANMSFTLTAGVFYTMAVGTFSNTQPALPANYTINVTPPAGGNIYSGPSDPGAGFSYTYVIIDNTTGNIKAIDPGADLTNTATYPAGTYQVYGLSYDNTIPPATLNGYVNGPFTTLQNDLLNAPGTVCGNLSNNSIVVTVLTLAPVQFTKLEALRSNYTVQLKWGTVSEQNASHFEIERSENGVDFQTVIGKVQAKGNSNELQHYSLMDLSPLATWNYYRVKQYDLDGKVLLSNVARVMMQAEGKPIVLFPNPVHSTLTVEYTSQQVMPVELHLYDNKGSKVGSWKYTANTGTNRFTLPVRKLVAGQYTLQLVSKEGISNAKFLKN